MTTRLLVLPVLAVALLDPGSTNRKREGRWKCVVLRETDAGPDGGRRGTVSNREHPASSSRVNPGDAPGRRERPSPERARGEAVASSSGPGPRRGTSQTAIACRDSRRASAPPAGGRKEEKGRWGRPESVLYPAGICPETAVNFRLPRAYAETGLEKQGAVAPCFPPPGRRKQDGGRYGSLESVLCPAGPGPEIVVILWLPRAYIEEELRKTGRCSVLFSRLEAKYRATDAMGRWRASFAPPGLAPKSP